LKQRIERIQQKLKDNRIEAFLVTNGTNRRYLSGFTGTAGIILITVRQAFLIVDFRYTDQAGQQAQHLEVRQHGHDRLQYLADLLGKLKINKLAFEEKDVTYQEYREFGDKLAVDLQPVQGWVEELRRVKDEDELACLKRAIAIADEGFRHITSEVLAPSKSEQEVALELEFYMRRHGASGPAFDFIVASGFRGALPHGVASEKFIQAGDLVVIDFGAVYQGYHSDITRSVAVAGTDAKQEEIYDIVLEAQLAAINALKPGLTGAEVDAVARKVIGDAGYADYFGHGLGHGVGLDIHEGPRLAPKSDVVLEPGMVVTVEPGIYLPEWGGVRIEDIVLVTSQGCEILTGSTKHFLNL